VKLLRETHAPTPLVEEVDAPPGQRIA
jgi:hypothetical protein